MINKTNNQRGFTLLETLVAISIVTLTIVGPLAMAAQASRLISVAKNQLIATYLAQEAMELVRYEKDSNMIKSVNNTDPTKEVDWLWGIYSIDDNGNLVNQAPQASLNVCSGGGERSCYFDHRTPTFYSCNDVNAHCDAKDTSNKALLWKHVPADGSMGDGYVLNNLVVPVSELTQTTFRRFIQIERFETGLNDTDIFGGSGAKVTVKVEWIDIYGDKTLYVQENIYKYR